MTRSRPVALALLATLLSGCWHGAEFPVFAQNNTDHAAELHVEFVRERDNRTVWEKEIHLEAGKPYSEESVAHVTLDQGTYRLVVRSGDHTESMSYDFGDSVRSLRIVVWDDRLDLGLNVV